MVPGGAREKMNNNLQEKFITYKEMLLCIVVFIATWFISSWESDRLKEKIYDIEKRLTRTEVICYGTGHSQSD